MKKLRFLVSLTTNDNDYQIDQAQSAEQMARILGAEVQIVYADNDAITQSTQILKAIQVAEDKRPDAVVFEPVGGTALFFFQAEDGIRDYKVTGVQTCALPI